MERSHQGLALLSLLDIEVAMSMIRIFPIACLLFISFASTATAELGPQLKIGDQVLQLNGAGFRTKTFVQIYESGLYLTKPTTDAQVILAADEMMAIRVRITSGFVSRASLVSSLQEGLAKSANGRPDAFARETEQLQELLKEEVKKNDVYDFVHVPTKGLCVLKNGKLQGVIPGLEFKKALFGIWLSEAPVDKELRQAMLSGKAKSY
jgi:hypothetical protein